MTNNELQKGVNKRGLDGNKLMQMWNIAHEFYMSPFRHVVNSILKRMFLGMHWKNCFS